MIISTSIALGIRCPGCNNIEMKDISLFELSGCSSVEKKCSCGETLLSIYSKDKKNFWLQYYCTLCDSYHIKKTNRKQLMNPKDVSGIELFCDEADLEIGFIGNKDWVEEKIELQPYSIAEMAEQMGFTKYFKNSEVMYEILEHIYNIAETNNLFCNCGNYNIEIEIFPEYIELICEKCGCSELIMAETEEDLKRVFSYSEIQLCREGFCNSNLGSIEKENFKKT